MRCLNLLVIVTSLTLAAGRRSIAAAQDGGPIPLPPPAGGGGFAFSGAPIMVSGGNSLLPLLRRPDVQSGISLSLRQKNELAEILNNPQKIMVNMVNDGSKSEEERKKEMEKQVAAQLGGPEEKIKAILKPEQYGRLQELMLQWKGAIILGDGKTADRLKLSPEHRAQVGQIASEYNAEKMKVLASLAQVDDRPSQDGGGNVKLARTVRMNTEQLENPLSPAYKALDAAKKDAESRILAVLNPEERGAWKKAQGEPFTFRKDIRGNRF